MKMDYPLVRGIKIYTNRVMFTKTTGYVIGDWLVAGITDSRCESFKVYNCYGYPVTNVKFIDFSSAIKFAELLIDRYEYYFMLWNENEQADVPGLTRYTIPNGLKLYDIFQKFDNQIITYKDIEKEIKHELFR